jgi:predicted dehydrogenase
MVTLAESKNRLLMVGFNRRYAPMYEALVDVSSDRLQSTSIIGSDVDRVDGGGQRNQERQKSDEPEP